LRFSPAFQFEARTEAQWDFLAQSKPIGETVTWPAAASSNATQLPVIRSSLNQFQSFSESWTI